MNDYPTDVELGLLDRDETHPAFALPCGCEYPTEVGDTHDAEDCLEAQVDALAEAADA
jgi:hypothetical protein